MLSYLNYGVCGFSFELLSLYDLSIAKSIHFEQNQLLNLGGQRSKHC
ncbi:hypothetical protein ACPOL_6897 (plasmid) [Acidisarcina polymorpha]|uniref:Uncharacterized protein n=1 Tax=Acidisarcina polymorpha TaxID=2211140 RepID=A0A2Z5GBX4_9BACT|nr:hypothetical protein ACPOL_6897 [Acidisarcina polymorpha]